jgi:hypothetical protein
VKIGDEPERQPSHQIVPESDAKMLYFVAPDVRPSVQDDGRKRRIREADAERVDHAQITK